MARREEQIELNSGSCTEVCQHDVLGRLPVRGPTTELTLAGGTEGSNPAPSTSESCANLTPPRGNAAHDQLMQKARALVERVAKSGARESLTIEQAFEKALTNPASPPPPRAPDRTAGS
jgi:hypothetical protein